MSRKRENRRFRTALIICLVIGEFQALVLGIGTRSLSGSGVDFAISLVVVVLLGVLLGVFVCFFPYAIVVLGLAKLFEQRKEVLDELGDENVVHEDPDGERKLHEYLTAITSVEARIGLLQRSTPYVPAEQRAPEGAKPPRARLSRAGWGALIVCMGIGAVCGAFYGAANGLGDVDSDSSGQAVARNVGVLRLFVSSMLGAALASPVGLIMVLVFGRVEEVSEEIDKPQEPDHDAGAGSPETT